MSGYVHWSGKTGRVNGSRKERLAYILAQHRYHHNLGKCQCLMKIGSQADWEAHVAEEALWELFGVKKSVVQHHVRGSHDGNGYQVTMHRIKDEPLCRHCRAWVEEQLKNISK